MVPDEQYYPEAPVFHSDNLPTDFSQLFSAHIKSNGLMANDICIVDIVRIYTPSILSEIPTLNRFM